MTTDATSGTLPPLTPSYILRGHISPIHALHFFRNNLRLISGDAEGWVVIWNIVSRRPTAVWRAHEGAILGLADWDDSRIVTHGRDHRLRVWQFKQSDEENLSNKLPVDGEERGNDPWLLHEMGVNALNFCDFGLCYDVLKEANQAEDASLTEKEGLYKATINAPGARPVITAVPNALDSGGVDFIRLPAEQRVSTLEADQHVKTGMIMALKIFMTGDGDLFIASGYEDGHTMVHKANTKSGSWTWIKLYISRPHSQPVLSLAVPSGGDCFFTTSADAIIAKHPIPKDPHEVSKPLKMTDTKHAGQQGVVIRSDSKIFATAGWDSRMRVYSCKTLRELAVLKWHSQGCYSVAFAMVDDHSQGSTAISPPPGTPDPGSQSELTLRNGPLERIKQQRSEKAQTTHWLAAGGKDGKVSLWDIY